MSKRERKPPSQTWRTFLDNQLGSLASIDFFTLPTATFRVLFVFLVLVHNRRRVVHFNVTEHPSARWTAQQIVEAFPENTAPEYMIRDRDGIYGEVLRGRVQGMGIQEVLTAPGPPGRIRMRNASSDRSVGNAWITSSSSESTTCFASSGPTSPTTTARGLTSRSARTRPSRERSNRPTWERSLRSAKSAACTTTTNAEPPNHHRCTSGLWA
jgi:hypothetical protein